MTRDIGKGDGATLSRAAGARSTERPSGRRFVGCCCRGGSPDPAPRARDKLTMTGTTLDEYQLQEDSMDLNHLNPQWIWIAAAVVGVLVLLAIAAAVSRRRAAGRVRPLSADARERYRGDWRRIEEMFVDRPATAVMQADELVNELVRARGLTTRHSRVAERYRAGRAVIERHGKGRASTEELRQALLHYRGVYED